MTPELASVLVAIAVPILIVVTLAALAVGVGDLERSRDELIELGAPRR
jgi:hypothetical protein